MWNSFGFSVLFVCHLLVKIILSDDNIPDYSTNYLESNHSLNGQYQQVQSELIETESSLSTKNRKYLSNNTSNQFIESPSTTEIALNNFQGDTNEPINNSLNINGINFDIIQTFWNFIEGTYLITYSKQSALLFYQKHNNHYCFTTNITIFFFHQISIIHSTMITQVLLKVVTKRKRRKRNGILSKIILRSNTRNDLIRSIKLKRNTKK